MKEESENKRYVQRNITDGKPYKNGDDQFFDRMRDYFKGFFDCEDVRNDPAYSETLIRTRPLISEFMSGKSRNNEIRTYIRESLDADCSNDEITRELNQIKQETENSNIDRITAEWVRDWHERKRKEPEYVKKDQEIRVFIKDALKPEESVKKIRTIPEEKHSAPRLIRIIRWSTAAAAAAAIMVTILLFRYLIPGDPDKIFVKYYEPYYAASVVTRNAANSDNESLRSALENYRNRNYQMAAVQFSRALLTETVTDMPRFYLGITFIELNEYDKAVSILEPLAESPGEFNKDARWYLGLLSLKKGDMEGAIDCFNHLALNPGFYSERSEKILRFLEK